MINKDFLKLIFAEKKSLIPLSDLRMCSVPKYPELSVQNIYPIIMKDPEIMAHFPDSYPKGREPDRLYMFNILHTKKPEYVKNLVLHAQKQRNAVTEDSHKADEIVMSSAWQ